MAAKKKTEKEMTIEAAFAQAQKRIEALEDDTLSLEDAFLQYREGMEIVKYLDSAIDKMEKKVLKVAGDLQITPFDEDDEEADDE